MMLGEELHGGKKIYSMFKAMGSIPRLKNIFTEAQDVKDLDFKTGYPEKSC